VIEQRQGDVRYLQFNHLSQLPELTHCVFTRLGGYSQAPFQSLNAALSGGDNFDNVIRNRLLTLQTLDLQSNPCATLWQVHGADVATLDTDDTWDDWRTDWPHRSYDVEQQEIIWTFKPRCKADAIITKRRGINLALSFGDCPPILLYDPVQSVLGIAHAGWRGTARGIAFATVDAMREQFGSLPHDIYAGIGPSIGPCCYEVSEHVRQLFLGQAQFDQMPTSEKYRNLVAESAVFSLEPEPGRRQAQVSEANFSEDSRGVSLPPPWARDKNVNYSLRLDLWQTNRNQLRMAGLLADHIELPEVCTACHTDLFFSHRAEHGKTGRFPAILALHEDVH
jgi:YfiH family protein